MLNMNLDAEDIMKNTAGVTYLGMLRQFIIDFQCQLLCRRRRYHSLNYRRLFPGYDHEP